ncbi:MFS transporter [Barrientosiimonas humi]|uniref:MFS transporter n=1 Tax=Barrientosiimonas humi TaxID=999931 RepID=UPI00370DB003
MSARNLSPRQRQQVAAATVIVATYYGMARFGLGLSAPRVLEDGVVTTSQIAVASSISFATYVIACFLSGAMLRHDRWRLSLLTAMTCAVLGCAGTATATTAAVFLGSIGVGGAAAGFASGAIAYRLARDIPAPQEQRSQAIANAGTGTGVAIATALIALPGGWRTMFLAAAVLALVATATMLRATPRIRVDEQDVVAPETPGPRRDLAIPVLLTILMGAGSSVFWTYGRTLVEDSADLTETASLLFWAMIGAAGIIGSISGDLSARAGSRLSWCLCSALLAASILFLPQAEGVATAAALGATFGAIYVILCGLTIELARQSWPHAVGAGTAILFATIAVGQVVGTAIASATVDDLGMPTLFRVGALISGLGAVVVWALRPPREASAPVDEGARGLRPGSIESAFHTTADKP